MKNLTPINLHLHNMIAVTPTTMVLTHATVITVITMIAQIGRGSKHKSNIAWDYIPQHIYIHTCIIIHRKLRNFHC